MIAEKKKWGKAVCWESTEGQQDNVFENKPLKRKDISKNCLLFLKEHREFWKDQNMWSREVKQIRDEVKNKIIS